MEDMYDPHGYKESFLECMAKHTTETIVGKYLFIYNSYSFEDIMIYDMTKSSDDPDSDFYKIICLWDSSDNRGKGAGFIGSRCYNSHFDVWKNAVNKKVKAELNWNVIMNKKIA
jgi:hypothetical protein